MELSDIQCSYCDNYAEVVSGDVIYPDWLNLADKTYILCRPCDAYVGCHADGRPLGTLANKQLRTLRKILHKSFDSLWKSKFMSRTQAYRWLSKKLRIRRSKCHIGMFDEKTCRIAITACTNHKSFLSYNYNSVG